MFDYTACDKIHYLSSNVFTLVFLFCIIFIVSGIDSYYRKKFLFEKYCSGCKFPGGKNGVMQLLYDMNHNWYLRIHCYNFLISHKDFSRFNNNKSYFINDVDDNGRTVFYYIDECYFFNSYEKNNIKNVIIQEHKKSLGENLRQYSKTFKKLKKLQKALDNINKPPVPVRENLKKVNCDDNKFKCPCCRTISEPKDIRKIYMDVENKCVMCFQTFNQLMSYNCGHLCYCENCFFTM